MVRRRSRQVDALYSRRSSRPHPPPEDDTGRKTRKSASPQKMRKALTSTFAVSYKGARSYRVRGRSSIRPFPPHARCDAARWKARDPCPAPNRAPVRGRSDRRHVRCPAPFRILSGRRRTIVVQVQPTPHPRGDNAKDVCSVRRCDPVADARSSGIRRPAAHDHDRRPAGRHDHHHRIDLLQRRHAHARTQDDLSERRNEFERAKRELRQSHVHLDGDAHGTAREAIGAYVDDDVLHAESVTGALGKAANCALTKSERAVFLSLRIGASVRLGQRRRTRTGARVAGPVRCARRAVHRDRDARGRRSR